MNKNIIKIGLTVVLGLFLVGCGGSNQPQTATKAKKAIVKKTEDRSGRPLWVSNPNLDGYKGVLSIVSKKKIKNKKKLYYVAKMKARAAFEARKGTSVDSSSSIKTAMSGNMSYNENIKIKSNSIQTATLIVKDTYEDKDNFYMWMVEKK